MFSISPCRWLALVPLLAATAAGAQQAQPAGTDYQSAFRDYQPYSDQKAVPWKEANDTVRQIGGWREYAREAAGAKKPDTQPAVSTPHDPQHRHHGPQPQGAKP